MQRNRESVELHSEIEVELQAKCKSLIGSEKSRFFSEKFAIREINAKKTVELSNNQSLTWRITTTTIIERTENRFSRNLIGVSVLAFDWLRAEQE